VADRTVLANALLLDPEAPAPVAGSLLLAEGRIAARLAPGEDAPIEAPRVDLSGAAVAPGFLDLHHHGALVFADPADGSHVAEALREDAEGMLRHGTTAFLATTVARDAASLRTLVTHLTRRMTQPFRGARPIGVHLEGPWINPAAAGAQPEAGIRPFAPAEGADLLDRGEGGIRMVTFAPEVEGASKLLAALRQRGVVAALGHSLAAEAELEACVAGGMTHVTHLFNAMGPMHHRNLGVAGFALSEERLTCDLICDGVHVHPRVVRVAARVLGPRLMLITDRMASPPAASAAERQFGSGPVAEREGAWRLADGRLAGSSLSLDRAVHNAVDFGALELLDAVAACTLRPARLLGVEGERGTLRPGARADLVVLDAGGEVAETWSVGRRVYARGPSGG
jgi:N-acetylglucosamine-6-phosphate deacetylase